MTAQHTPGPWQAIDWVCHAPTTIVRDYCGERTVVAECSGSGRDTRDCLADAQLIAASPDLLAALQPFVGHNSSDEFITIRVRTEDVTRARAAIAKATGSAS